MKHQNQTAIAQANRALDLAAQGRIEQAITELESIVTDQPGMAGAMANLGALLCQNGAIESAMDWLKKALYLRPDFPAAWNNYGHALLRLGSVEAAYQAFSKATEYDPCYISAHSNRILTTLYRETSPQIRKRVYSDYRRAITQKIASTPPYLPRALNTDKRIKIGFISPDFRQHSVAFFLQSVMGGLDKSRFEIELYADNSEADAYTRNFQALADRWHASSQLNDNELTQLIREHELAVLFDLCGHFTHNRQAVFAARAAPIQVAWLGYPGPTQTPNLDFYIADHSVLAGLSNTITAPTKLQAFPEGFHCYTPPQEAPAIASPPCTRGNLFTFGCFNNLFKISPQIASVWGKILRACPQSQLVLKSTGLDSLAVQKRILQWIGLESEQADRIQFLLRTASFTEHLNTYNKIDVALDTYPYNGTTTTCEALWMGVPTINLRGTQIQSRIGGSLLEQVGIKHFCAHNPLAYTALAQQLYLDREKIIHLRSKLRSRVQASSLIQPDPINKSLARSIEQWVRQG